MNTRHVLAYIAYKEKSSALVLNAVRRNAKIYAPRGVVAAYASWRALIWYVVYLSHVAILESGWQETRASETGEK